MDGFVTIRLHKRTVKRFKRFSKKITKSYSETMETVMDFFEWHGISPFSRFASQISKEEEKTRKRINAVIAIIRDIEQTQTKPTAAMLLSLFGEKMKEEEKPVLVEKKYIKLTREEWNKKEEVVPKSKYDKLMKEKMTNFRRNNEMLSRIEKVVPRFGKPYYKIEIDEKELVKLQSLR